MKHRVFGRKLSRTSNHRKELFKLLVTNLFQHGKITTTEAKAKSIRGLADSLISRAQSGTVAARRILERFFGTKQAVNQLVDGVAPAMKDRTSGFTTMVKLGKRRGDDAEMVRLELISPPLKREVAEKPVKTVAKKPVAEKPAVKKPAAEKPAVKKTASKAAEKTESKIEKKK